MPGQTCCQSFTVADSGVELNGFGRLTRAAWAPPGAIWGAPEERSRRAGKLPSPDCMAETLLQPLGRCGIAIGTMLAQQRSVRLDMQQTRLAPCGAWAGGYGLPRPRRNRSVGQPATLQEVVRELAEQHPEPALLKPSDGDRTTRQEELKAYLQGSNLSDATRQALRAKRQAGQGSEGLAALSKEEAEVQERAFTRRGEASGGLQLVTPDSAAFCKPEPQWFAVQVYYREGTEKQPNDARRIGVAAAWLERAMNILKPVTLPDGTQIPRVIEPWVPKKKIKAVNPKTLRPSNKTLIWDNAETLLFKGVMDSELAYYLERQMAPVSESLDAKVAQVSVRIAKQTGGRNMSSFGGAPVRTMLHGYKFSRRIYLQPMEMIRIPSRFPPGEQDELEARMQKAYKKNNYHVFPVPCPESFIDEVDKWLNTEEQWDQEESIRNSRNIALMNLFGVSEDTLDKVKEASQARRQAEAAALKAPDGPASQPAKRRSRRRRDAELTPEQEAEALFNPGAELDLKPAQQGPRNASAGRQAASAGSQAASAASVDAAGAPVGPATQSEPGREVQGAAAPPLEGTSRAELGGKAAGGGEQPGASSRLAAQSGAVGPPPSRSRSIRHGHEFMESAVTVQASAPAGWNVGSMPDRPKPPAPKRQPPQRRQDAWHSSPKDELDWQTFWQAQEQEPAPVFEDTFNIAQSWDANDSADAPEEAQPPTLPQQQQQQQQQEDTPWPSTQEILAGRTLEEQPSPQQPYYEPLDQPMGANLQPPEEDLPSFEPADDREPVQLSGPPRRTGRTSPAPRPIKSSVPKPKAAELQSPEAAESLQSLQRVPDPPSKQPRARRRQPPKGGKDQPFEAPAAQAAPLRGPPARDQGLLRARRHVADSAPGLEEAGRDDEAGTSARPPSRPAPRRQPARPALQPSSGPRWPNDADDQFDGDAMSSSSRGRVQDIWYGGEDAFQWDMPTDLSPTSGAEGPAPRPGAAQDRGRPPRGDASTADEKASIDAFFDSLDSSSVAQDPTQPGQAAGGRADAAQPRRGDRAPRGQSRGQSEAPRGRPQGQRGRTQKGWYGGEGPGQPDSLPDALTRAPQRDSDRTRAPGWRDRAAEAAQDKYGASGSDGGWYTGEDVGWGDEGEESRQ